MLWEATYSRRKSALDLCPRRGYGDRKTPNARTR